MFFLFVTLLSCDSNPKLVRASNSRNAIKLKIGISISSNTQSDSIVKGAKLALKKRDVDLPGGKVLELDVKDDEGDINKGILNASRFADDKNVICVIGHRESFISIATSSIYEHQGIIMISPFSRVSKLTENGYQYIFRTIPRNEEISQGISKFLKDKNVKTISICYKNGVFGYGYTNALERIAEANGITLLDRISYSAGNKREFNKIVNRFDHFGSDAIVFFGDTMTGLDFYRVLDEKGINQLVLSNHEMADKKLLELDPRIIEGTFFHMPFNVNDNRYHVRSFIRAYRDAYGEDPDYDAAVGYDSINLIVEAILEDKSYNPRDIAKSLRKLRNQKGILFKNYSFDDQGNMITDEEDKRVSIQIAKDGVFEFIGEF